MPPSRELGGDGSWLRAHPNYHPEEHVAPAAPVVEVPVDPSMVGADERGCAGVKPAMSQLDRTDGFKAFIGVKDGRFLTTVTMTVPSVAALQIALVIYARRVDSPQGGTIGERRASGERRQSGEKLERRQSGDRDSSGSANGGGVRSRFSGVGAVAPALSEIRSRPCAVSKAHQS